MTSVQYNSVFCTLDEYGLQGMIHISEVSPGRIRNIREHVQEGKKIICMILRLNRERNQIDLSLRRVTETQKRAKNLELKAEMKAEKLIEHYAQQELKQPPEKVYQEIAGPILKQYEYVHFAFNEVAEGTTTLEKLGVPKPHATRLSEIIVEKMPPKNVTIKGTLSISTYAENGVETVQKALLAARAADEKHITINYLGNGQYRLVVTADEYEIGEAIVKKAVAAAESFFRKLPGSSCEYKREEA